MLTTLPTIKLRLSLSLADTTYDTILVNALGAITARFDAETNRTLARTVDDTHEFDSDQTEILVPCYPIESVTRFQTKISETTGWIVQSGVEYLLRKQSLISLASALDPVPTARRLASVTYTGGYLLPGSAPVPSAIPLPPDLEQAAVEQVAFWFQSKDKLGLKTSWPTGHYEQFVTFDLLPSVTSVLRKYTRLDL